ncbi:proton-coupled folate transporter-like [Elysia marginata]|uniref:Proton-coupled folate transporter-like n=1 Tax=Elysia marginata TaxID=1093978 RepID=A0AAV4HPD7_9GAST|nr:proton-coupled folate transporter-like [Elysia marginata]
MVRSRYYGSQPNEFQNSRKMTIAEEKCTTTAGNESDSETTRLLSGDSHREERRISVLRAQIVAVLVHTFIISTGFTYWIVLTEYLVDRTAREAGYDNLSSVDHCSSNASDLNTKHANEVQEKVADLLTTFTFVQTIPAFFVCFLVGSYSDYIGRRVLLLMPIFTQLVIVTMTSLIIRFNLNVNLLYVGFAMDGIAGSWPAVIVLEFAITADLNASKDSRTTWMYVIICTGSIMLSGVTIATSYLIQTLGFFYASLLLTSMGLLCFLIPLLFLQETLVHKPTNRVWNPLFHCQRLFGLYVSKDSRRRRVTRVICLAIFVFSVANDLSLGKMDSLYQLHEPFCWDALTIGEYASIRYGASNIGGAFWLAILRRFFPVEVLAAVAMAFQTCAYAFEALIKKSWQFLIVPGLLVPNSCAVPIVRSMLSLLVASDQQGAVFSSIAVVETLCLLCSGTAYNQLYGATVSTMPGAVYLLMSSCAAVAGILFLIYFIIREKPEIQVVNVTDHKVDSQAPLLINT